MCLLQWRAWGGCSRSPADLLYSRFAVNYSAQVGMKLLSLFGIVGLLAPSTFSGEPEIRWEVVSPYPGAQPLHSVCFGRGTFVAAGDDGIYYSTDQGITWHSSPETAATLLNAV